MKKVIIDTDIGTDVDDAVALVLALKSPELRLEAITTVYGDVDLRSRIVLKLLKLMGKLNEVPVASGVSEPLLKSRDVFWAGHEGKGILTEEDISLKPMERHAVDLIIEKIQKNPGEITLIAIGPLTNIALAIIKEPQILENVKELIMMGGVARIFGNAPYLPFIEHNIKCDPEAASVIFRSNIPITMVGLDVTTKVPIDRSHLNRMKERDTPLMNSLVDMIEIFWNFTKEKLGWSGNESPMHDPLAVTVSMYPDMIKTIRGKVLVETTGNHTTGETIVIPDSDANVKVACEVDDKRFIGFLMDRILNGEG